MRLRRALPVLLFLAAGCGGDEDASLLTARRGDLDVTLRLRGTLRAMQEVSIKAPRSGEIGNMVANGARVKAGQLVLEMDSEEVENALREHTADVQVREAELRDVQKEVEKARHTAKLDSEAAKLVRQLEESRLKELKARPTDRERLEARIKVELAEALAEASAEAAVLVRELVDSGYAPEEELRSAQLDLAKARADLAAARARRQTVEAGASTSDLEEARLQLAQANLAEQFALKSIATTDEWTETKLARFSRRLERENEKLAEAERRLDEHRVTSPVGGIVLYAPRHHGGIWQVGQRSWQGATVMTIPETSRMKVIIQIPAGWVRRLESSGEIPARVTVPALPDRVFPARLVKISSIGRDEFEGLDSATTEKLGRAERQVFEAEIHLDEEAENLLPGFGAEAEVILSRVEDAIIVPRMALIEAPARPSRGGRHGGLGPAATPAGTVYVKTGSGYEERTVSILARNSFEAAVKGPVVEGDLLYPGRPPGTAQKPRAEHKPHDKGKRKPAQ